MHFVLVIDDMGQSPKYIRICQHDYIEPYKVSSCLHLVFANVMLLLCVIFVYALTSTSISFACHVLHNINLAYLLNTCVSSFRYSSANCTHTHIGSHCLCVTCHIKAEPLRVHTKWQPGPGADCSFWAWPTG